MAPPDIAVILDELLELSAEERTHRLDVLRRDDPALHAEAFSLLAAFESALGFLEPPPAVSPACPAFLGKYSIEGELGRGAFGTVYLGRDPDLGRHVAIKVLNLTGTPARLREEARLLAAISQPNVAAIYTIESIGGGTGPDGAGENTRWIITMEHVLGRSLLEALREAPLPLRSCLDIGRQIAAGLEAAHGRGIVHCDLSPRNVRLAPDGWVKILDFGLAALAGEPGERGHGSASTAERAIRGTPGFLSPEQAEGNAATPQSDLFALGSILFECLTGRPAIEGETTADLIANTRAGRVARAELERHVPSRIRSLLDSCLAQTPAERPGSARDVRHALEEELLHERAAELLAPSMGRAEPASPRPARGNVPATWSRFIGRDTELVHLAALLDGHRLLTLTGPGGVGKTRLAVELASRRRHELADGAWFVDLAEITAGSDVPGALARALALHDVRAQSLPEDIASRLVLELATKELLVVLDNCEHVLDAAAALSVRLLTECPHVRLLATSRAPFGLPGEQVYAIVPMDLPLSTEEPAAVRERDAVRLFEARASQRDPAFQMSDRDALLVADLCARLDGLPLAIELAASHVRRLPLETIHERVKAGRSLSAGSGVATGRHRSLRDLVEWSHRLLSDTDRLLFARLALFRGGWTLETAEAVCAGEGIELWEVCDAMSRLVDTSLVRLETDLEPARYRFLETIRAFASDRLAERPAEERAAIEERFLERMVAVTSRQGREYRSSTRALRRIELEYVNVLHALERGIETERYDVVHRLGIALATYWVQRGYWAEGLVWLERIRTSYAAAVRAMEPGVGGGVAAPSPGDVALLTVHESTITAGFGQWARSAELAAEGVALARAHGDPLALADVLCAAALAAGRRHERPASDALNEESLALFRAMGRDDLAAACLLNLSHSYVVRHDIDRAEQGFREFHEHAAKQGDRLQMAKGLTGLARCALMRKNAHEAIPLLKEALALDPKRESPFGVAVALGALGAASLQLGATADARRHYLESLQVRRELGHSSAVYGVLVSLSDVLAAEGRVADAFEVLLGIKHAYETGRVPASARERTLVEEKLRALEPRVDGTAARSAATRVSSWDERTLIAAASGIPR